MAVEDVEKSSASAAPIELYKFVGTFNTYLLTSHEDDQTNADGTYLATVMDRGDVEETTQEEADQSFSVQLPYDHPMVTEYARGEAPPDLALTIYRVHANDLNDAMLMWTGEVLGWTISGLVAKAKVPSLFAYVFDNPCPAPRYQAPCNHVLGDTRCGVDMDLAANSGSAVIDTAILNAITVIVSPLADGSCKGGQLITTAGEYRMIIDNVGTLYTISSPFSVLNAGDVVTIKVGCDLTFRGDCQNKFNNSAAFGGFPLIPDRNPFKGRI